ncbi:MAG TPA: DinB family protein [Mucilaginibacter sp.]
MNAIDTIRKLRATTLTMIEGLTLEQLNKVPAGFNNNIIWNLGTMIAAQQNICYTRSGLPIVVDNDFFESYKSGSKPERPATATEVEEIKSLLFSTLDRLEKDQADGLFKNYTAVVTRYGVELTSVQDAIDFLPFHDGFHMAYLLALKRMV